MSVPSAECTYLIPNIIVSEWSASKMREETREPQLSVLGALRRNYKPQDIDKAIGLVIAANDEKLAQKLVLGTLPDGALRPNAEQRLQLLRVFEKRILAKILNIIDISVYLAEDFVAILVISDPEYQYLITLEILLYVTRESPQILINFLAAVILELGKAEDFRMMLDCVTDADLKEELLKKRRALLGALTDPHP